MAGCRDAGTLIIQGLRPYTPPLSLASEPGLDIGRGGAQTLTVDFPAPFQPRVIGIGEPENSGGILYTSTLMIVDVLTHPHSHHTSSASALT
jgi:hypothetical protein